MRILRTTIGLSLLLASVMWLAGCGAGGGEQPGGASGHQAAGSGTMVFRVLWPEGGSPEGEGRLIPVVTTTIAISVSADDIPTPVEGTITRPESTLSLSVPAGSDRLTQVNAKAEDATVVAKAQATNDVPRDGVVPVQISLASTIATVEVSGPDVIANPGDTAQLTATAKDSDGAIIPLRTDAPPFTWTPSDPGKATVSDTGVVTYLSSPDPSVTITAEEKDSGVEGSKTLRLNALPALDRQVWVYQDYYWDWLAYAEPTDTDGSVASWSLDFGDGSPPQSGQGDVDGFRRYSSPGSYVVSLTVTDNDGGILEEAADIDLAPAPKIAFVETNRIWVTNPDGPDPVLLTDGASGWGPDWSPDGAKIAFVSVRDHASGEIYVMNADGSGVVRLTNNTVQDKGPDWLPNGRIGFVSAGEIYVMDADGSNVTRVTNNTTSEKDPDWKPTDGSQIAFVRWDDVPGEDSIYTMDSDGSNVVERALEAHDPAWSPDGTRIAYAGEVAGSDDYWEIRAMDADGSNKITLRASGWSMDDSRQPAWSPDGTRIAFAWLEPHPHQIWVMDSDGSNLMRFTDSYPGASDQPAWCPIQP